MGLPPAQGLYDPRFEHDACGLGFVATLNRAASHDVVEQALEILVNLTHRGAAGCDPCTGDGAGILLQIPHELYSSADRGVRGFALPAPGDYAVAMCFFSQQPARRRRQEAILEAAVEHHGQRLLGWRDVPIDPVAIGPVARESMPVVRQLFIGREPTSTTFEQQLYLIRKRAGRRAHEELGGDDFYIASASSRTVVYKGLMLAEQVGGVLPRPRATRAAPRAWRWCTRASRPTRSPRGSARIRSASSRTTARSTRCRATARGWRARVDAQVATSSATPSRTSSRSCGRAAPTRRRSTTSSTFSSRRGRSLPHVMMMLDPEGVRQRSRHERRGEGVLRLPRLPRRAVGRAGGARLHRRRADRRHARSQRPAPGQVRRHLRRARGAGVASSACSPLDPARVVQKGRVQPGKMFLVDTDAGRVVSDEEIKHHVATQKPYREWLDENRLTLSMLPEAHSPYKRERRRGARACSRRSATPRRICARILGPMAVGAEEPVGSMGVDTPLAVLERAAAAALPLLQAAVRAGDQSADRSDPRRDGHVAGELRRRRRQPPRGDAASSAACSSCRTRSSRNDDMARLRRNILGDFRTCTLAHELPRRRVHDARARRTRAAPGARSAVQGGGRRHRRRRQPAHPQRSRHLRRARADPEPAWRTAAVHHHLIRSGTRVRAGLVIETAEPREVVAHVRCSSASAPARSIRTSRSNRARLPRRVLPGADGAQMYIKALKKGLLKTMSKMGISAVSQLPGRADLRGGRHRSGGHRQLLHRHRRRASAASAWPRSPRRRWRATRAPSPTRPERELDVGGQHTVAHHRRGAPVDPRDGGQAAGGGAARRRRELRRVRAAHQRSDAPADDAARDVGSAAHRARGAARGGRAGGVDRQALRHRRDVVRHRSPRRRTRTSRSR